MALKFTAAKKALPAAALKEDYSETAPAPAAPTPAAPKPAVYDMCDRLADLLDWEDAYKKDPRYKELEALKKKVAALAHEKADAPDAEVTLHGETCLIIYAPATETRTVIDYREVQNMLGDDMFYALCSVPLTKLDEYLTEDQKEKVIVSTRGESRRLKGRTRNT